MGLNIVGEKIEVSGYDATWLVEYATPEALRVEFEHAAEELIVANKQLRTDLWAQAPKRPRRFSWWRFKDNRQAQEHFARDQETLAKLNQEPPIFPPQPRAEFLAGALRSMSFEELEELFIVPIDSKHAVDLKAYFVDEAESNDRGASDARDGLEWVFPRLKKAFPHLTLADFIMIQAERPFLLSDQQELKDSNKFTVGLFDAELYVDRELRSIADRDRYLGYVAQLSDFLEREVSVT